MPSVSVGDRASPEQLAPIVGAGRLTRRRDPADDPLSAKLVLAGASEVLPRAGEALRSRLAELIDELVDQTAANRRPRPELAGRECLLVAAWLALHWMIGRASRWIIA